MYIEKYQYISVLLCIVYGHSNIARRVIDNLPVIHVKNATVEPVLRSPGLSSHLYITAMDTRSQIFSHTNVCIVVCIKRSPV